MPPSLLPFDTSIELLEGKNASPPASHDLAGAMDMTVNLLACEPTMEASAFLLQAGARFPFAPEMPEPLGCIVAQFPGELLPTANIFPSTLFHPGTQPNIPSVYINATRISLPIHH